MTDWTDRIALVTGASRGLGHAVAERLGAAGAQVIAVARTVGGLEEADDAIKAGGGPGAVLVPLDIRDDDGLARLGAAVNDRWGRLDLWVHTAVSSPMLSPVEHIEPGDLDPAIAVNLRATQRLIRVLDPLLRRSDAGRAVFVHDPVATDAFNATYVATKAGQRVMAEAWAMGVAQTSPVRVLHAAAPPMRTALRARFHPGEDTSRLAAPADVAARLIAALAEGRTGRIDLRDDATA